MPSTFQNRQARLDRLLASTRAYVADEKARIDREVAVLAGIANSRAWGNVNQPILHSANSAAEADLKTFLSGT